MYFYIYMERCLELYRELLNTIKLNLKQDVSTFLNYSDSLKTEKIQNFYNSLSDNTLFLLFSKTKIKVFSAKTTETFNVSCSLFGEVLSLKYVLNNQQDLVKNQMWSFLFRIYLEFDKTTETPNEDRSRQLNEGLQLFSNDLSNKVKNDILKVDVNSTTNNMIDDIVGSFQNILNNKSNPFDNIMNITTMISDKYKNQLESGEVQLDKIMGGIEGVIPSLLKMGQNKEKETVIINETFSTADVDVGKEEEKQNIGNMMKMIPNMTGLVNMVNKINTAQSDTDILNIKQEMDSFLENDLKVNMTQFSESMSKIEEKINSSENK